MIALSLVCIGILAYGVFFSQNTISDIAYLIGFNLPLSFFIWIIFYAIFIRRKKSGRVAAISFLIIYCSMIASALIGSAQQKHEAMKALEEVHGQYSAIVNSSIDSEGLPVRIEKKIDTNPKSKGEFGELERFLKDSMNQFASQRNDYLLELEAIGWNGILDPQRIRADKELVESKVIIRQAKIIVEKYRDKTDVLLRKIRRDIQSLNMSSSQKEEALSGFDRGLASSQDQISAMWILEEKAILEFEKIINFLSKNDAWVVAQGQILFKNNTDINTFNSYIGAIQAIVNQQQQIQKQSMATVNRNFDRLRELE